jgi:hypothetical protein
MLPSFQLDTIDIFSLEYGVMPRLLRAIERRIFNRGIAAITELAMVTKTAKGALYSEHQIIQP